MADGAVAAVVARDRTLVWAGIVGLTAGAWGYLLHLHGAMAMGDGMTAAPSLAPALAPWTVAELAFTVVMWAVLMGILFVTGVMNLLWVAAITGFVLLEKVALGGRLIGRVGRVALIGGGLVVLARVAGLAGR